MESTRKLDSLTFNDSPKKTQSRLSLKRKTLSLMNTPEKSASPVNMFKCNSSNGNPSKVFLTEFDDLVINVRPLGLDHTLKEWLESRKSDPVLSNSSAVRIKIISLSLSCHTMQKYFKFSQKYNELTKISRFYLKKNWNQTD